MEHNISSSSAYRKLRTNIEYNEKHPHIHSVCLTGADYGAGATTISVNLAYCFVANTPKVLLMNCNIKDPHIHEHFNIKNDFGLTDILEDNDYTNYLKYTKVIKDSYSGNELRVITAGNERKHPIDLLSGKCFKKFMQLMKSEYDFIIVDCPSLESCSDVIPVSHLVDGTILVVSLPETDKNIAKKSIERLKRNGAEVLGTVLNKVE